MTDKYAVIGNPIAHSKSPQIHMEFAKQTNQDISYKAILAPLNEFEVTARRLIDEGYKGVNVTVPFKLQAFLLSNSLSPLAKAVCAVNTLILDRNNIQGHNTDGIGLINDITQNLNTKLQGKRILLLGAGGAAQGVLLPLWYQKPKQIIIANRNVDKAVELINNAQLTEPLLIQAYTFDDIPYEEFDLIINATSASLSGEQLSLSDILFNENTLAYDMMYGRETPFMQQARANGAKATDGLGMLVEQAAEAFYIWRNVRPQTAPVIAMLRNHN